MEPFLSQDSKGVDRSMQMSVSFNAMHALKGSNLPSQVTVGEIPPPTPTPMKSKGLAIDTRRKLDSKTRKDMGDTSSLLIGGSSPIYNKDENNLFAQDKNMSQSSNGFVDTVSRMNHHNEATNMFSFTNLNHNQISPSTPGNDYLTKPESADVNIIDQSDAGLKSHHT